MSFRRFTSADGTLWAVLEVKDLTAGGSSLQFVAGRARRRLSPIPKGWKALQDSEMEALLQRAKPTRSAPE